MASDKYILLVEDNPDDEALTLRALKKNKVLNQVIVARDGAEAIDFLLGAGPAELGAPFTPQMILLDLKLPKVDGLEVLKAIRENERTKLVPVIVLTTSKEESDLIKSYSGGANSYIRKPVDFEQFTHAVQQLSLYWLVLNEMPPIKN